MSEIFTVPASGTFRTGFPAANLFVEELSIPDARFIIEGDVVMQNGDEFSFSEEVKKGSRLQFPGVVYKWNFKNTSALPLTVTLKAGLIFYDEQRLVGDINALTRPENLTANGNRYFASDYYTASSGTYNQYGIYNPIGSGITAYINTMKIASSYQYVSIKKLDSTQWPLYFPSSFPMKNKDIGGAAANVVTGVYQDIVTQGTLVSNLAVDTSGDLTDFDFGNSPIAISEGEAIAFAPGIDNQSLSIFAECWEF
jgi:hypothetical protein